MSDDIEPTTPDLAQTSPFWRFSLRFYRLSLVSDACLVLQEEAGLDVNLLLFLLWHATERRALTSADVAALDARVRAWRETAVVPLRHTRRALKALAPTLVAPEAAAAFRDRVKAVELEAERLQQEAMYALVRAGLLGTAATSVADAARTNVAAYADSRGRAFPQVHVEVLLKALERSEDPPPRTRK